MKTLSQPLRRRINQLAHRLAAEHALKMKAEVTGRLMGMAADGAGYEALAAELDRLESGGALAREKPIIHASGCCGP